MEIYIEYALLENFILDGMLLFLTVKTLRLPVKKGRIFFAAALGALFAVVYPLFSLKGMAAFVFRYAFGLVLPWVAAPIKSVKEWVFSSAFFYLYTFAAGGLLLGMGTFFELEYDFLAGGYIITEVPVFTVLGGAFLFLFSALKIFSSLYKRYSHKRLLYRCKICLDGITAEGIGLLDTGNSLTCNNLPVCLLDKGLALQLFSPFKEEKPPLKTLYVHTATGAGELKIFQAEIKIYSKEEENIIDKAYFAIAPNNLGKGYQIILQPQLFKEERRVKRTSAKNT